MNSRSSPGIQPATVLRILVSAALFLDGWDKLVTLGPARRSHRQSRLCALHGAHLTIEMQHFRTSGIAARHPFDHPEYDLRCMKLKPSRLVAAGKSLRHVRH